MSRYSPSPAYGHSIRQFGADWFRLHWTCDRYYKGSRFRHPTGYNRDTDEAGARRFARRHGNAFPEATERDRPQGTPAGH